MNVGHTAERTIFTLGTDPYTLDLFHLWSIPPILCSHITNADNLVIRYYLGVFG